jgi:ferredoxin
MSPVYVRVDQDVCMASGFCSSRLPEVFAVDALGLAALVSPDGPAPGPVTVPGELVDRVWDAANGCPACAIHVTDDPDGA